MFRNYFLKKFFCLVLIFTVIFQAALPAVVFAEDVTASNSGVPSDQTSVTADSSNTTTATNTQSATIDNQNNATVDNNTNSNSNTGDNTVSQLSPTPSVSVSETPSDPTPSLDPSPSPTLPPDSSADSNPQPQCVSSSADSLSPFPTPSESTDASAEASVCQTTTVSNTNDAAVTNEATASSSTGSNQTNNQNSAIQTGDATSSSDLVNMVNTNLVGMDFWQALINQFSSSSNDIDLTKVDNYQDFSPDLISVLAQNSNTKDGSVNISLANLLSIFSVYNKNEAKLTNDLNVSATTGANTATDSGSTIDTGNAKGIDTGNASASLNLMNMVNTNIVGSDWFFGVINLFKDFKGDIILPYELQFLGEDQLTNNSLASAQNQNGGESSTNLALADNSNTFSVNNNNNANVLNNINVNSNTGNNLINGSGNIQTGDANSSLNLMNIVNTNIVGDRWLFLIINNFGTWSGNVVGWWGNMIFGGDYAIAWVKLPPESGSTEGNVNAQNLNTPSDSANYSSASRTSTLSIENTNSANVENNINVSSDTGNNSIYGTGGSVQTGNANSSANVLNLVNTNIIGSHWFFGMINIFDSFIGDIIFPRPDLSVVKTSNKTSVTSGDEITYTISYKNTGKLWAKDTVITDVIPSGESFVSASNEGVYENGKVTWNLGKIATGETGSVTLVVKTNSSLSNGTNITNTASVTTSTNEPNKSNNSSSATTVISNGSITSQGGNGDGRGGASSSQCSEQKPVSAPTGFTAAPGLNPDEVNLSWTAPAKPYTYFLIAYSDNPVSPKWGNPNIGDTTNFTVSHLPNGTFYFWVRAGNGCMPGDFVGPITVSVTGSSYTSVGEGFEEGVLGASTDKKDKDVKGVEIANQNGISGICQSCTWWQILAGEVVVLFGVYLFLTKYLGKKRFKYSIIVPILAYILFLWLNKSCNSALLSVKSTFWACKFFWALDILVFAVSFYILKGIFKVKTPKK